jgi:LCP family protein required for cell wall assembly
MYRTRFFLTIFIFFLVFAGGLIIIYNYLNTRLTGNSISVVRAMEGVFSDRIEAMPSEIEIITHEEFMMAMEENERELTDEELRLAIERVFNPDNVTTEFAAQDAFDKLLEFGSTDDIFERDAISDRIYNLLLIGDDARIHEDRGRSDSMILISYNRDTRIIHMTSFVRDILVPINVRGSAWNRLNSLHATGGPGRTINTVNRLFSLDIQRYVVIRFSGVFELVDALGGLELTLTAAEATLINRIFPDFDPVYEGLNILNGRQTLAYTRIRILDNDFVRTQRQRNVLKSTLNTVLDASSIIDIFTLAAFMLNHVETNVPLDEVITLGLELFTGSRPVVEELRIPITGSFNSGLYYDAYIFAIDFTRNITALHEFVYSCTHGVNYPNFVLPDEIQPVTAPIAPAEDNENTDDTT